MQDQLLQERLIPFYSFRMQTTVCQPYRHISHLMEHGNKHQGKQWAHGEIFILRSLLTCINRNEIDA